MKLPSFLPSLTRSKPSHFEADKAYPPTQRRVGVVGDLGEGVLVTEDARLIFVAQVEGFEDPSILADEEETALYGHYFEWLWHLEERVQWFIVTRPVTGQAVCPTLRRRFQTLDDATKRQGYADWIRMLENRTWYQTRTYAVISQRIPPSDTGSVVDPADFRPAFEITVANVMQSLRALGAKVRQLANDELEQLVAEALGQMDANAPWASDQEHAA